jgi:TP901 family phage tail tape measure protein
MADAEARIGIDVDVSNALAGLRLLQKELARFNLEMAKGTAAQRAQANNLQRDLINNINASGQFASSIKTVSTSAESFTNALEKNKLSMGQYFKYSAATSKSFSRIFSNEFNTIEKVARERVKTLQTQYVKLGRDASGAMKAIAVRPLALDMDNLSTRTAVAAQKQAILNQLLKQGSTNLLNFGKNTQWAGRQLMVGFTIPLTIFGAAAAKSFMQMEEQAIKFKRVYGDTFTATEETDKMIKQVKELASEFTKYGVQVEKTMEMAADAAAMGNMGAELLAQIRESTKLSVLGGVNQEQALETTISLTNAFGIAAEDLAGKIDFLNAVENQTVTAIEDLTIAIPKAAPVIKQLGGSVEDLAFFLTAMKEGGINASEGANALKSGLASLINPAEKTKDMLSGLGINIDAIVEGNAGNVKNLVIEFAQALDTLDPLSRARAIEQLFGKFQFSRISTLFQNVVKEGTQAQRVLKLTASSAAELRILTQRELKRVEDSPMFKFQKAIEDLKVSLAPLGEAFLKAVTPLIKFGTDLLNNFNKLDDGTKGIIVTLGGLLGVVGPVALMTFGLLANGVANLIKLFVTMGGVFSKSKLGTQNLATSTQYLTQEQLEADAVAASLNSKHIALTNTFSSEAAAINNLVVAYNRALTAQGRLLGTTSARGKVLGPGGMRLSRGIESVPGPRGAGDIVPAMLSPGEAVIPAKQSEKYGSIISAIMKDEVPGFRFGRKPGKSKSSFGRGVVPQNSNWSVAEGLLRTVTGRRGVYGPTGTAYENRFLQRALRRPGKQVAVRMYSDDMVSALSRGDKRYKNVFETGGKSRGSLDEAGGQRAVAEQKLFGFGPGTDPQKRPAYGYVFNRDLSGNRYGQVSLADRLFRGGKADPNERKFGARNAINQSMSLMNDSTYRYGDIAMVLRKKALRGRTTTTQGDSLNAFMNNYATPAKFGTRNKKALRESTPTGRGRQEFVEAQILGGFSFKDIKRIVSTEPQTILALQTALKSAGIRGIRVGMPKMTMMQKIRSALKMGPGYPTKVPRIQSEGPYAGMYRNDPLVIGGRTYYNKGVVSVPGPKGAGDVVPAMLSPGEAVIPAKFADRYAPLINAMVQGKVPGYEEGLETKRTLAFDRRNTLEAAHLAPESDARSAAQTRSALQKEIGKAIRLGLISKSDVDTKSISQIKGKENYRLFSQQMGLLPGDVNQAYTSKDAKGMSARAISERLKTTQGLTGAGTASNLKFLQQTSMGDKYKGVTDTTMKKYLMDLDKNMQKNLKVLGDKQLTERQLFKVYKDSRIAAEKAITDLSQRSAIKLANRFGDLKLSPGTVGGSGESGRTMKNFPIKGQEGSRNAQSRLVKARPAVFGVLGKQDPFLSQNSIRLAVEKRNSLNALLPQLSPEGRLAAERGIIAAGSDPKRLDKVIKDIKSGKVYGPLAATTAKQSGRKSGTVPVKPKATASRSKAPKAPASSRVTRPQANIVSRENLGNGVQRTVSQNAAGRVMTSYFLNGKKTSEAKALQQAQLSPTKSSAGGPRRGPTLGAAAGTVGGAGMTAGMMMSFSGDEGMAKMGQGVMMAGVALSMLPMLANPIVATVAAVAALAGGFIYLNVQIDKARQAAVDTAEAMSMTSKKLTTISEFTGTVSATDIRKEDQASFLTAQGATNRQFGANFIESDAGKSMLEDIQTQLANGIGRGQSAENIGVQLSEAISQGILSVPEAKSIAASIGAQINDYGFALRATATITSILGPNGEKLETEPLQIALDIQNKSMKEFEQFSNFKPFGLKDVYNLEEAKEFRDTAETTANIVTAGAVATGLALAPITGGISAGVGIAIGAIAQLTSATLAFSNEAKIMNTENVKMQGLVLAKGAQQLALQQRQLDALKQNYRGKIALKQEEIVSLELVAETAETEDARVTALEKIKTLQSDISDLKLKESEDSKLLAQRGMANFYQIAEILENSINPNEVLNKAIESNFEGDELMIESAKQSLDAIRDMDNSSFKVFMQLGVVSGELSPSAIERLMQVSQTSGTFQANFDLLLSQRGMADANLITQLLDNSRVGNAVFSSLFEKFTDRDGDYDSMLKALSIISNIESRYGVRVDLNTDGEEQMDAVVATLQAVDEFPDEITKETFAKFKKIDPPLYDAIMADWDRLTGTDDLLKKDLIIDAKAIGDWDAVQQYLIASGKMGEAIKSFGGPIVADRVTDRGNFIDKTTGKYRDEAAVSFLPTAQDATPSGGDVTETETDTGSRSTILDGLLNRLKQIRDASINATGGIAELLRVLGKNKTLQDFVGFDQQLVFKGYGPEFIEFLNGLDKVDRNKFLVIENGVIRVTAAGKAANKAFAEAALGDFQFSLAQGVSNINMSVTAMNKLTAAGLSNADAYEIATDAALSYAIATATTKEEIEEIVNLFNKLKNATAQFDMSTVDGLLGATGEAFGAINEYFSNRKAMVDLDFQMGTNQSGYNTLLYSMDTIQETIAASGMKIFDWEYAIDDLEYLLEGIQEQEDAINETYDKRIQALEKTNDLNKSAMELEKAKLSVADAITTGDIAAAARAAQEYREKEAAKKLEDQRNAIEAGRESALNSVKSPDGKTRKQIEKEILDLKKLITAEEEKVLEPAEKNLTYAERARDVAISMVEKENYLGKNEKQWRAIELAIKDTVTKTNEWKNKVIEVFKLIPGFKELLDKDGNVIGFEFDPSVFQSWIDALFNGIRGAVQAGVEAVTNQPIVVPEPEVVPPTGGGSGGSGGAGSGAAQQGNAVVGGTGGLLNPGPVIADITPGELEALPETPGSLNLRKPDNSRIADATAGEVVALPIIITKDDANKALPKNSKIAKVTDAEMVKTKPKPKPNPVADRVIKPKPKDKVIKISNNLSAFASGGMVKRYAAGGKVGYYPMGGLIPYMNNGGLFKSINTDTVPAMLSPGEFVVRRHAVNKYGVDKMKSINNGTYGSESVYNYNLSVNVRSESNPDEIAKAVMSQIKRIDSQRLRSNRY